MSKTASNSDSNYETYSEESSEINSDSDVSSDSSEHIDKTKGNENLGVLLNGKYILINKIGYGTFSCVWLAYKLNEQSNNKFCAIKIQHIDDWEDGIKEARYLDMLKKINCANIINLHEWFQYYPTIDNKRSELPHICMVFDILYGSTYQLIRKGKYENGLDEEIVLQIIKQTANALKTIQYKLNACHLDIKPENILINRVNEIHKLFCDKFIEEKFEEDYKLFCEKTIKENNFKLSNIKHKKKFNTFKKLFIQNYIKEINTKINKNIADVDKTNFEIEFDKNIKVCLADFGTLKPFERITITDDVQTRYYRAPEVLMMCNYNEKADIWSLGCSAFELLTGNLLFNPEKNKHYSTDFHHIYWIMQLMGEIPSEMRLKSKNADEFFDSRGKFREKIPKLYTLKDTFKELSISISDNTLELLNNMLAINPKKRFDYDQIINWIDFKY